jgi:inner membrane transporter RhtA
VLGGLATMVASAASNQVGAAVGAHAFAAIGPVGVVAVRQLVAAAVLLPVARPNLRRFTWAQWWPTLLLALVFATMNLSLYTAIDRIGLGLAVTLEVLGPLGVALAGSRTRLHLLCAAAAGLGVYLLVLPGPSSDYLGVGLGLLAAACWAAYILLNRLLGNRLPGLQAPAAATAVSALLYLPVVAFLAAQGQLHSTAVLYAVGAGLLSSVVPYAADLVALRRVPARFFGVVMSIHPVLAALAGLVILQQVLDPHEWAGIGVVVTANVLAVAAAHRQAGQRGAGRGEGDPAAGQDHGADRGHRDAGRQPTLEHVGELGRRHDQRGQHRRHEQRPAPRGTVRAEADADHGEAEHQPVGRHRVGPDGGRLPAPSPVRPPSRPATAASRTTPPRRSTRSATCGNVVSAGRGSWVPAQFRQVVVPLPHSEDFVAKSAGRDAGQIGRPE